MIHGAHVILSSTASDADRAFLKDVLGLTHVDVGGGWLIFGLPPAEVAVHPGEKNDEHSLYLMTDDVEAFAASMIERGIEVAERANQGWGILTSITLPGGGKLGVYEPRHARPKPTPARSAKAAPAKKAAAKKTPAKKAAAKKTAASTKAAARKPAAKKAAAPKRAKSKRR